MATYKVIWEIDIEADSPLEAAKEARACQHPATEALGFEVIDAHGMTTFIDLYNEE
jgi:hypothetical protein